MKSILLSSQHDGLQWIGVGKDPSILPLLGSKSWYFGQVYLEPCCKSWQF